MESSTSEEDAIVPGVNRMGTGNIRPKLKPRQSRNMQNKIASKKPSSAGEISSTTTLSIQDLSQSLDERKMRPVPVGGGKRGQLSLKDLCVEDKQRIANLIKELAKVGEEREKAREELEKERRDYEMQILKLVEQQEQILAERQEIERQLQECRQLLWQSQSQNLCPPQPPLLDPLPPSAMPHPYSHPHLMPAFVQSHEGYDHGCSSMLANVGSPQSQRAHLTADAAGNRCQQTSNNPMAQHKPTCSLIHLQTQIQGSSQGSHRQHLAGNDLMSHGVKENLNQQQNPLQYQQQQHQPHTDFFTTAMQQSKPHDIFGAQNSVPVSIPADSSKEEVINRFFASQATNLKSVMQSPKLRSMPRSGTKLSGKVVKHGEFLAPIMSSTQKSTEIVDYLSLDSQQEFVPLARDQCSPQPSHCSDDVLGKRGDERREKELKTAVNRVMFAEGKNKQLCHYSPSRDGGDSTATSQRYHKMSQAQHKDQLLQQRAQLLEEQQRLKHILSEQEAMLREKQLALSARSRYHSHAVITGQDGGDCDDPLGLVPQRLAIDAALERQRAIVDCLEKEAEHRNSSSSSISGQPGSNSNAGKRVKALESREKYKGKERLEDGKKGKKREETGKNQVAPSDQLSDVVRKLDYSLHSDSEDDRPEERQDSTNSTEEEDENDGCKETEEEDMEIPSESKHDVGTSISYRTIRRIYQDPVKQESAHRKNCNNNTFSVLHAPFSPNPSVPGEKTMSVLEIINSLHSPGSRPKSVHHKADNSQKFSSYQPKFSSPNEINRKIHPYRSGRRHEDEDIEIVNSSSEEDENDDDIADNVHEEDLEESQILEEIFFIS